MGKSQNCVAVITGSATGIGAAIAEQLANKGWNVLINYTRSEKEALDTAKRCEGKGVQTAIFKGSIALDENCRGMVDAAIERWGRVDALVNNAGTTKIVAPNDLEGLNAVDFEKIFSVNVIGSYQMARAAATALRKSEIGAIVNISSSSAFTGGGSSMAYAASKGALNTLTKSLAIALSPEVRVNAICPGYVDTRWVRSTMNEEAYNEFKRGIIGKSALRRMVSAEDVADMTTFLILVARNMTGETLILDAGIHLSGSVSVSQ